MQLQPTAPTTLADCFHLTGKEHTDCYYANKDQINAAPTRELCATKDQPGQFNLDCTTLYDIKGTTKWPFIPAHNTGQGDTVLAVLGFILLAIVATIYFVPALVARKRDPRYRVAIFSLNLLLGWTFIGWVVALVWALSLTHAPTRAAITTP